MKSILFACFLIVSSVAIGQDKTCNLWLGDVSESTNNIEQFAEKYLEIQTKLLPAETNNIQEMRDDNELAQIKVWLKPKKMLVSGAMATVYTISSYKIVTLSNKIDELYTALVNKVQPCTTETTAMNTFFGNNKMFIERNSGGFGKKGLANVYSHGYCQMNVRGLYSVERSPLLFAVFSRALTVVRCVSKETSNLR